MQDNQAWLFFVYFCIYYCFLTHLQTTNLLWPADSASEVYDLRRYMTHTPTHTHTHLMALFPGLPRWADTRKVKPIWILVEQETMSGNGISWAICKSAPCCRQTTTPAPHHSFFTGRMPFLPPNQQRQSTEGKGAIWMRLLLLLLLLL